LTNPLEIPIVPKGTAGYLIISCNTVEELSGKVSVGLKDGIMFLHGNPFVFKDQICQAIKLLSLA
jgi:hypothetical protein